MKIDAGKGFGYLVAPFGEGKRIIFMYAVIRTGAKQYRVQAGDVIKVELLDGENGKEITLDDVLLVADGDKVLVGKPTVGGARVTAEVVEADKKAKKVIAFKFHRREGYHRTRGVRAHHTVLKIKEITVK